MTFTLLLFAWWFVWIAGLATWKFDLFKKTWNEAYIRQSAVLIESDDWGPGNKIHALRLEKLLEAFSQIRDSVNRPAVMSADIVLSVPDIEAIKRNDFTSYQRKFLSDGYPEITSMLLIGIQNGTLVPQLHGLEHLHGEGLMDLVKTSDIRVTGLLSTPDWCDWESLESPLQAHYVDGTSLPTKALSLDKKSRIIQQAAAVFSTTFGFDSTSTVAPCYLWDDEVEKIWKQNKIEYIQTAGYRCTFRDKTGKYIQNPSIIRPGDINKEGQIYLVRNVMFEPVDGKNTVDSAFQEAKIAQRQCLPIVISTHRYNYTGDEKTFKSSFDGLSSLLNRIREQLPAVRFLSSPELGNWYAGKENPLSDPLQRNWPSITGIHGIRKLKGFLYRLWYRHSKIRLLSLITGLFIPGGLLVLSFEVTERARWRLQSAQ